MTRAENFNRGLRIHDGNVYIATLDLQQRMYPIEKCVFASSDNFEDQSHMMNLGTMFKINPG